jgi:hypothetical protein
MNAVLRVLVGENTPLAPLKGGMKNTALRESVFFASPEINDFSLKKSLNYDFQTLAKDNPQPQVFSQKDL